MAKNPAPKTTHATEINIWVLATQAAGRVTFPNAIEAVSAPHMRRCMKAGLLTVTAAKELQLTPAGIAAVNALARTDSKIAAVATTEAA